MAMDDEEGISIPANAMIAASFKGDAVFSNEAFVTTDPNTRIHRLAFLEVDPNGMPHLRCAVIVNDQMLERLADIFAQRLNKPSIIKPEHYKAGMN